MIVGGVVIAALVLGRQTSPPITAASPSPQASVSATTLAPSAPPPIALTWDEPPLDSATFAGAVVVHLEPGADRMVAFGRDLATHNPLVWVTTDGRRWDRHEQPAWVFGGGVPTTAAVMDDRIVALGWKLTERGQRREIWTSRDGASWTRDLRASSRWDDAELSLTTGHGLVLASGAIGGRAAVLWSNDGERFVDFSESEFADAGFVTVRPIATGFLGFRQEDEVLSVWRSADGWTWEPTGVVLPWAHFEAYAEGPRGRFIVGEDNSTGTTTARLWLDSGTSWQAVGADPLDSQMNWPPAFFSIDGGVVALGTIFEPLGDDSPIEKTVAYVTRTATYWSPDPFAPQIPIGGSPGRAAAYHGRLFVIAFDPQTATNRLFEAHVAETAARPTAPTGPPAGPSMTPGVGGPGTDSDPILPEAAALTWHGVDPAGATGPDAAFHRAIRFGSQDLIVGAWRGRPAIWHSSDALTWHGPTLLAIGSEVADVAAGERLVAVGKQPGSASVGNAAEAWWSADGHTWHEARIEDADGAIMTGVAAGAAGYAAVGSRESPEGQAVPLAWTSTDGRSWSVTTVPLRVQDFGAEMTSVTTGGPGWVAGGAGPYGPEMWTSTDARSWQVVDDHQAFENPAGAGCYFSGSIAALDVTADGLLAAGSVAADAPICENKSAVFTSADGLSWTRLPDAAIPETGSPTAVGAREGSPLVGAASERGGAGGIWLPTAHGGFAGADEVDLLDGGRDDATGGLIIADISAAAGRVLAVGAQGGRPMLWLGVPSGTIVPGRVCPTAAPDVAGVAAMTEFARAACLTRGAISLTGFPVRPTCNASYAGCDRALLLYAGRPAAGGPVLRIDASDTAVPILPNGRRAVVSVRFGLLDQTCQPPAAPQFFDWSPPPEGWTLGCLATPRLESIRFLP